MRPRSTGRARPGRCKGRTKGGGCTSVQRTGHPLYTARYPGPIFELACFSAKKLNL